MNDFMYPAVERFEPPTNPTETCGIVYRMEDIPEDSNELKSIYTNDHIIIDTLGMKYLADKVVGFMTMPVALVEGNPITAKTVKVYSIKEFKDHIKDQEIYLYEVLFYASYPAYETVDTETYATTSLKSPEIIVQNYWKIRYATL